MYKQGGGCEIYYSMHLTQNASDLNVPHAPLKADEEADE